MRREGEGGGRHEGGRSAECWTGLHMRREAERRERGCGS